MVKAAMDRAQAAYSKHKLLGSSEKDIVNAPKVKAAGAEVNARRKAFDRGLALVSAPPGFGSYKTLDVASLPCTTDSLHACLLGAWTSAALFRRPVLCCLDACYRLVQALWLTLLGRRLSVCLETLLRSCLISILGTIAVTDTAVPYLPTLFAIDS